MVLITPASPAEGREAFGLLLPLELQSWRTLRVEVVPGAKQSPWAKVSTGPGDLGMPELSYWAVFFDPSIASIHQAPLCRGIH